MGVVVKPKNLNERQMKRVDRIAEANPERARRVSDRISARREARGAETAVKPIMKKGGKAEKGGSFGMLSVKAGIDKNPKATFADKIAGAKKKAMKMGGKAAKQAAIAIAMKKAGKTPKKKMQCGGTEGPSNGPFLKLAGFKNGGMKKKYKSGGTVSMQLGTYTRQIGKNYTGKNVVNKGAKAKMGKSVGKCKSGC